MNIYIIDGIQYKYESGHWFKKIETYNGKKWIKVSQDDLEIIKKYFPIRSK